MRARALYTREGLRRSGGEQGGPWYAHWRTLMALGFRAAGMPRTQPECSRDRSGLGLWGPMGACAVFLLFPFVAEEAAAAPSEFVAPKDIARRWCHAWISARAHFKIESRRQNKVVPRNDISAWFYRFGLIRLLKEREIRFVVNSVHPEKIFNSKFSN